MLECEYDLILQGGHVIDPANEVDGVRDVAIAGGKIAAVEPDLPVDRARKVINVAGSLVTPGLVDIHVHAYGGYSGWLFPDEHALPNGTTTVVDTGSAGWRTFKEFKATIINRSRVRVLAFLNIVGRGMLGPEVENNTEDMEPEPTARCVAQYPEWLVGTKTAHFQQPGWTAVDRTIEAGRLCGKPAMIDFAPRPERSYEELILKRMRPGDIHTHVYAAHIPLLDDQGRVQEFMWEARRCGVIFDVGHGTGSFWFRRAVPAIDQGFIPDSISTDMHKYSILIPQATMPPTMSKLLNIGMSLREVVRRATLHPALEINRPDLGTLSPGAGADVAVFQVEEGEFGFVDSGRARMRGTQRLRCLMTLRDGEVVWDLNGLAWQDWRDAGEYGVLNQYGEDLRKPRPAGPEAPAGATKSCRP
ncbi:MAG: amidohydrolase/deacetylase family metallohydrolase [Armatimonadetes bacterium]|nr:amidohydrolase/deacetylase family metallohydrolase [Armatimonadota bacterium]